MEDRNGPSEGGGIGRAGDQRLAASFSRWVRQSSGRLPPRTRCSRAIRSPSSARRASTTSGARCANRAILLARPGSIPSTAAISVIEANRPSSSRFLQWCASPRARTSALDWAVARFPALGHCLVLERLRRVQRRDLNKRIAFAAADVFLRIDGWRLQRPPMQIHAEMIQMFEAGTFDIAHLDPWLREFSVVAQ